jgi:hypothetical protein
MPRKVAPPTLLTFSPVAATRARFGARLSLALSEGNQMRRTVLAAAMLLMWAAWALAQDYPNRPIRINE